MKPITQEWLNRAGDDLLTRKSIERSQNYLRRQAILDSAKVIYALP